MRSLLLHNIMFSVIFTSYLRIFFLSGVKDELFSKKNKITSAHVIN